MRRRMALSVGAVMVIAVVGTLVAAVQSASSSSRSSSPRWAITDLGSLGGKTGTEARALNDRDWIVGLSHAKTGPMLAFLWRNGRMVDLGRMPLQLNGTTLRCGSDVPFTSYAVGINQQGQIVGQAYCNTVNESVSFLWQSGKMVDLGSQGVANDVASDPTLNDRGEVVGTNRGLEAFLWRQGKLTGLGALPGRPYSQPVAINELGQVIGNCYTTMDGRGSRAFLWWKGKMTAIGPQTGKPSYAVAINDRGQVAGTSGGRAFVWRNGRTTWLGSLPGRSSSAAVAINERGQVVGTSGDRAVVWQGGKTTDLGVLPGRNTSTAVAINAGGQVVGSSSRIGRDGRSTMMHAVLWEGGRMTDLGVLPGAGSSVAVAVNDRGTVAGNSGSHAVAWRSR